MKVKIVDPPSGWLYGFPAVLDETITFEEQLRKHNYPERDIELAKRHSRYWEEDVQERYQQF
jgi:hypothetical protein